MVSENQRNRATDDCIVIPIFSSGRPGGTRVFLPERVGGIPHDSVLFCEELTTIAQSFLDHGPLGAPCVRLHSGPRHSGGKESPG